MNFLILTPDGVCSTYLQRALTVYLNASGEEYFNTHELLNGLSLDLNMNLYKVMRGYRQSLQEICDLLDANQGKLVSRLAQYHVENRSNGNIPTPPKGVPQRPVPIEILERNSKEDYLPFYEKCNTTFDKILYCVRDPFEYSLSWGIRNITGKFNVYSMKERIETHGEDESYIVDLDFMKSKLDQYQRYLYWVKDNFSNAIEVVYDDLHNDVDLVLSNITGLDYSMKDEWGISLQEHSTLLYKMSLFYPIDLDYSDKLLRYQQTLIDDNKMFKDGMPIKMNTLQDKSKKVSNFLNCLETYNTFADSSNEFPLISEDQIYTRIERESEIYELVD